MMLDIVATNSQPTTTQEAPLLAVRQLCIGFPQSYGSGVNVLDHVDFELRRGEALGIVGESGCGKSLLGGALMGLLPATAELSGAIDFADTNLLDLDSRAFRRLRGGRLAMIYQDALSSLNPGMTIGAQLRQAHRHLGGRKPAELLEMVGLDPSAAVMNAYPHQLSGGQRQRVLIALALSGGVELLIADEPTTALDVTVEAQIIDLLARLRSELGFTLIFISHDLGVVSEVTERIAVMYAGQLVESGPTAALLTRPRHPYAGGLIGASRSLEERHETLAQIPGVVPSPKAFPSGCRFRSRCSRTTKECASRPPVTHTAGDRQLSCFHPLEDVA